MAEVSHADPGTVMAGDCWTILQGSAMWCHGRGQPLPVTVA